MMCCWNEELKEWYGCEGIGIQEYRCLGCNQKEKIE
jgi:hypothetical protein